VPLIPEVSRQGSASKASQYGVFFESLLPQGESLKNIARQKQLDEKDSYGLLKALGRDVAGAVQIFDPKDPYEQPDPFLEKVSASDIRSMLHSTYSEPLGNTPMTGMMSLGGYQNKIMLVRDGASWNRAHNGHPTTHIIKPHSDREDLEGIIYCEAYGLDLARKAGVLNYDSWIEDFDGEDALVIERFDRAVNGSFTRIHQENALQAMGLPDSAKYEMMNHGKVSLKLFAKLLRSHVGKKAQLDLLGTTVVNAAIGNLDAHPGNLGILHHPDGSMEFAPAYDMVVNSHYLIGGGDQPMALLIGGEYQHKNVSRKALINEGVSWGLKATQVASIVDGKLDLLKEAYETIPPHEYMPEVAYDNVGDYLTNFLNGKTAGNARL
jgi:serine/threonine-protein kinase HipA